MFPTCDSMVVSSQHEVEDLKQKLADAEGDIKVGPWLPLTCR